MYFKFFCFLLILSSINTINCLDQETGSSKEVQSEPKNSTNTINEESSIAADQNLTDATLTKPTAPTLDQIEVVAGPEPETSPETKEDADKSEKDVDNSTLSETTNVDSNTTAIINTTVIEEDVHADENKGPSNATENIISPETPSMESKEAHKSGLRTGSVWGIAIGVIGMVVTTILLVVFILKRRRGEDKLIR